MLFKLFLELWLVAFLICINFFAIGWTLAVFITWLLHGRTPKEDTTWRLWRVGR